MSDRIYIDVDDIVNEYMINLDDDDYGSYVTRSRVRNLAYGAIRDLNFDTLKNLSSVMLPINESTQRAILPEDFVDWVRVGVLNSANEFLPMSENKYMANLTMDFLLDNLGDRLLDTDGAPLTAYNVISQSSSGNTTLDYQMQPYQRNAYNKGGAFGLGGGHSGNGQFAFDKQNGSVFVDTSVESGEFVLVYIADESMKKNPRIPTIAIEAVKAYIYKNIIAKKVGVPQGEKRDAVRAYNLEKKKVRARANKLNKAEIMFQISKRTQSAPRGSGRIYE